MNAPQSGQQPSAPPLFTFSRGSLGPPPQRYNAVGLLICLAVLVALVVVGLAIA
jgi:hypothetical protein